MKVEKDPAKGIVLICG